VVIHIHGGLPLQSWMRNAAWSLAQLELWTINVGWSLPPMVLRQPNWGGTIQFCQALIDRPIHQCQLWHLPTLLPTRIAWTGQSFHCFCLCSIWACAALGASECDSVPLFSDYVVVDGRQHIGFRTSFWSQSGKCWAHYWLCKLRLVPCFRSW
jgi:hypothetical protein